MWYRQLTVFQKSDPTEELDVDYYGLFIQDLIMIQWVK